MIFTVTLGGVLSASRGAFLDIDDNIVYTAGTAPGAKDKIDLIYDGTNLWTPTGCATNTNCPSNFKSILSGSASTSAFYILPANVQPSTKAIDIEQYAIAANMVNNVVVATKGIYYMQTSENSRALILIGAKDAADFYTIELIIGYSY